MIQQVTYISYLKLVYMCLKCYHRYLFLVNITELPSEKPSGDQSSLDYSFKFLLGILIQSSPTDGAQPTDMPQIDYGGAEMLIPSVVLCLTGTWV